MALPTIFSRRSVLLGLALTGCGAPLPPVTGGPTAAGAKALIDSSADAHGLAALQSVTDISVRYEGRWAFLVNSIQPALVDAGFRGRSEERLLLADRMVAQSYTGPKGHKQVVRRMTPGEGTVQVWYNGAPATDTDHPAAAALVADGYSLFLLGPMLLAGQWATDRRLVMELAPPETITVFDSDYPCDVVRVRMQPGMGLSDADELAVFIARDNGLMRRVRFSLNGLDSTKGAIAEVDVGDHIVNAGVQFPTRFHERLLRPALLPVHDWRMSGLDLNRGLTAADLSQPTLLGAAATPAAALS